MRDILRPVLRFLITVFAAFLLFYGALWLFQTRFIYFPRLYTFALDRLPPTIQALSFESGGLQHAYYVAPRAARGHGHAQVPPKRLWVVFAGNAMTALDWSEWALAHPDDDTAFLLIEYPGYGASAGSPSRPGIAAASDAAFATLAALLHETPAQLAARSFVLGHSLGAATGLEFAGRHPVAGVVLTAPFSTIGDVAAGLFGPPVRWLIRERYDNIARLDELKGRGIPVTILHGTDDEVIDFALGARLARSAPWVRFQPIEHGHHNDLYEVAAREIRSAMLEVSGD